MPPQQTSASTGPEGVFSSVASSTRPDEGVSRHRARLCPGPETGLHCRAGPIQSGVENVPNTFEDGWCTPFAATGDHQGWHADTGQPCTNTLEARPGGGGGRAGPSRGGGFSPGTQTPLLGVAAFFLSPGMLENLHGRPE